MRIYAILGGSLAVLALVISAYFYGVGHGKLAERDAWQRVAQSAERLREKRIVLARSVDLLHAAQDRARQDIFREINREVPKIVSRPGYAVPCFDDDGLRLISRAIAAANGGGATGAGPDDGAAEAR